MYISIVSAIAFLLLFVIWSKSNGLNFFIKCSLLALALAHVVIAAKQLGFL